MLKVTGEATLKVRYVVNLPCSEEQFEALSEREAQAILDEHIDWSATLSSAETDDIDVWDYEEVEDDK